MFHALIQIIKGVAVAVVVSSPLLAVQNVRAGHENIIEGRYEMPRGAGLVLMVSLKRAR